MPDKNNIKKAIGMIDGKVILSTLWIFVVLNYLYCDVMTLMDPVFFKQIITGKAGAIQITQGFLLCAAILMEIPIALVLMSRVLKYTINRWVNIIAGIIMTAAQISSMFAGTPTIYYLFFSAIEISCTLFIIWYAWKWKNLEESLDNKI
jgi:hypothetical protein